MKKPKIAVVAFPGMNCEVESLRSVERAGMEALYFRWNDSHEMLADVDGYFLPGGFSYEDRGRSGMVAARDPLLAFIAEEAQKGKVVIGNCNGAQILVESGLIPLDSGLRMSLARNVIDAEAQGFLNEWVWIRPSCPRDRCATSDWDAPMHLPIAHGEGRFTTKDPDLIDELKKNDQLAFSYCDADGNVSDDPFITPNGSVYAIAGICNPAGNVVALMPHPERTTNGDPYFISMRNWIETRGTQAKAQKESKVVGETVTLPERMPQGTEIFIDTIITNNEERTVEQAAHRILSELRLVQLRYLWIGDRDPGSVLSTISIFNPNKETAYIRRGKTVMRWNDDTKREEPVDTSPLGEGIKLLRRDDPDTGATAIGGSAETGICYVCSNVSEDDLCRKDALEIFANPHASTLERLV